MSPIYHYRQVTVGALETNCYLVFSPPRRNCLIIDPGGDPGLIIDELTQEGLTPRCILLTHGHIDHCGAVTPIREKFKIPLLMAPEDLPILTGNENHFLSTTLGLDPPADIDVLIENEDFKIEDFEDLDIVKTPGHTPGSICLKTEDLLFSGDTVFAGSIGRTDLPGGSDHQIQKSLDRIRTFPRKLKLLPGHGPLSDLDTEFNTNPFF